MKVLNKKDACALMLNLDLLGIGPNMIKTAYITPDMGQW